MIFEKYNAFRLPNNKYQVVLFASNKIYGNAIGVNKGIAFDYTNTNYVTVWRKILKKHEYKPTKKKPSDNQYIVNNFNNFNNAK